MAVRKPRRSLPLLTRRNLVFGALEIGVAVGLGFATGCGALGRKLSCNELSGLSDAERAARDRAEYLDQTVDPARRCDKCQHFHSAFGTLACGECTQLQGPVNPAGCCDRWEGEL
jgi:hypothetical protein